MSYMFFPPDFFSKSHSHPKADSTQSSDSRISLHSFNENSGFVKHNGFQFSGVNQTQSLKGSLHCLSVVRSSHVGDSEVVVASTFVVVVALVPVVLMAGSVEGVVVDCDSSYSSSFPLEVDIVFASVDKVVAKKPSLSDGSFEVVRSDEVDVTTTVAVVDRKLSDTSPITD